jgi:DNA helicase HerA-like ATPase
MMTADEACGVFQVLLEQFRSKDLKGVGKVVAFDEAHKYLSHSGPGCVELSNAIVDSVRLMRHDGLRVLISTQSPTTMPPELLELASVTILHRFQSAEWSRYLTSKVTLPEGSFEKVKALSNGRALLLSTQISRELTETAAGSPECITVDIRPRLTKDWGASKVNRVL